MAQNTLSIKIDKKTIVSKPFDFKAMTIINEKHNDENVKGPLAMCCEAVDYMFEGTEATQEVIEGLAPGVRAKLCAELWRIYLEAFTVKND